MLLAAPVVLAGCLPFDSVGAYGDEGRVYYSVDSDDELSVESLRDVGLVTGYDHMLSARLTEAGADFVHLPRRVEHHSEGGGLIVSTDGMGSTTFDHDEGRFVEHLPSLRARTSEPGYYAVATLERDRFVDRLPLRFERPDSLSLVVWVIAPTQGAQWERVAAPVYVEVGAELAILVVPQDVGGSRLAGRIDADVSTEPPNMTAPVWRAGVVGEVEAEAGDGVAEGLMVLSPGTFRVTVSDAQNGISRWFTVVARPRRQPVDVAGRGSVGDLRGTVISGE